MSNYYKVNFKINPENNDAADLLAAFLADAGFESFEYSPSGIDAYIQESHYDESEITDILRGFPFGVKISWDKEFIPHTDWNEEWEKKYFKPIIIGNGKCVVHSTFHNDFPDAEYEVIVDPKMAFGTGHHATTTMMANHLFNLDLNKKKVMDMGTGTGILAIIAKKLGAGDTIGIEIDPGAYDNAVENVKLNNVEVTLINGDSANLKDYHDIDIFLANINRNIILADIERYASTLHIGSLLLLSGFYKEDVPLIENALKEFSLDIEEIVEMGEGWTSVMAIKK